MRVTIKGLTGSTITFNTLGIILRGDSKQPELYPTSIARHIEIKNDEQMREVIGLKNAKLISVEREDVEVFEVPAQKPVVAEPTMIKKGVCTPELVKESKPESKPEVKDAVEDSPVKKLGRPKGSKNIDPEKVPTVKEAVSKIKKLAPVAAKKEETDPEDVVTIMTDSGPVKGKAVRNVAGEIKDSERTRASIEALAQIEAEENVEDTVIDESTLPEQERMGGTAVFATGDQGMKKSAMKSSILPEAEAIKNSVKFISMKDSEILTKEEEDAKNAFIDKDEPQIGEDLIES